MKKKIILVCLMAMAVAMFTGCDSKDKDKDTSSTTNSAVSTTSKTENSKVSDNKKETVADDWGVKDSYIVFNDNDDTSNILIRMPSLTSITEGGGNAAYQKDGTLVLMCGQYAGDGIVVEDSEHVLDVYKERFTSILDSYRNNMARNFEFDIQSREIVKVNDYEMCKYKGTHKFVPNYHEEDVTREIPFVAYSVQTKEYGLQFLWMVLDDTKDQSANDLVESNADKMAQTFEEVVED